MALRPRPLANLGRVGEIACADEGDGTFNYVVYDYSGGQGVRYTLVKEFYHREVGCTRSEGAEKIRTVEPGVHANDADSNNNMDYHDGLGAGTLLMQRPNSSTVRQ